MLLAAASYFESRITRDVLDFCIEISGANPLIPALVTNKAITRQYHSWFSWDASNANNFFALFDSEFKSHMADVIIRDEDLRLAIKVFIELGRDRNRLVHGDYATFSLEKTPGEIYSDYQVASNFVERISVELRACSKNFCDAMPPEQVAAS